MRSSERRKGLCLGSFFFFRFWIETISYSLHKSGIKQHLDMNCPMYVVLYTLYIIRQATSGVKVHANMFALFEHFPRVMLELN